MISRLTKLALISALVICAFDTEPASAASEQVISLNNEGVTALKAGNYILAAQKFLQCLKLDPTYKPAKENVANCYNGWGISLGNNPAQAIEKFHKSLFYAQDNLTAALNLVDVIQKLGKDPDSFKDRVALGKQARLAGDIEGGIVEFSEALKIKDDPALRVELGNAYYVRDRTDDAITQYNIASKNPGLDPDTKARVYRSLGQAYQAKKDYPHSVEAYNVTITLNPADWETLEANKAVWTESVGKDPLNPANRVGLGDAWKYLGDFGETTKGFPQDSMTSKIPIAKMQFQRDKHLNNGVELQTRKLYDAAIQEYRKALEIDQDPELGGQSTPEILLNLGSAYQAKEDYLSAITFYAKALEKNPYFIAAQEGLKVSQDRLRVKQRNEAAVEAGNLFKSGNFAEALKRYQTLLAANPKDPAAHFDVAVTLQRLGEIDAAIAEYTLAVQLAPENEEFADSLKKAIQDKADSTAQH